MHARRSHDPLRPRGPVAALLGASQPARWKRNAVRLTDQDHVNTAAHRAYAGGGVSDKNCALCSTAGAINLLQGRQLWTTGMIAASQGRGDGREALGSESVAQARSIKEVVCALGGVRVAGETGGPGVGQGVPLTQAVTWMAGFPQGTVFVVLASGSGIGHHWLNATASGPGAITYVDYQTDKVRKGSWNHGHVATDNVPFHGVSGQHYDAGATVYAIAFQP